MARHDLIDLDHLDRYVAGDRSLRDEILGIFEEQAEMWTRMLDPGADDQAWRDAAHALKGASRGVGAWEIGDTCQAAEKLIGEARDEAVRHAMLRDLKAQVDATIAEVRRLRDL